MLPPKPHSLGYFEGTLFHQPIVDFPFEHPNVSKKNILYQERYGGVTWQRCWSTTSIPARAEQRHHVEAIPQGL